MKCIRCGKKVYDALRGVPGVSSVELSLAKKTAVVTFDEETVTPERLSRAVEEAGYHLVTD